jgi:hypothetical protein
MSDASMARFGDSMADSSSWPRRRCISCTRNTCVTFNVGLQEPGTGRLRHAMELYSPDLDAIFGEHAPLDWQIDQSTAEEL